MIDKRGARRQYNMLVWLFLCSVEKEITPADLMDIRKRVRRNSLLKKWILCWILCKESWTFCILISSSSLAIINVNILKQNMVGLKKFLFWSRSVDQVTWVMIVLYVHFKDVDTIGFLCLSFLVTCDSHRCPHLSCDQQISNYTLACFYPEINETWNFLTWSDHYRTPLLRVLFAHEDVQLVRPVNSSFYRY